MKPMEVRRVSSGTLDVAYFEWGPAHGKDVVLLHGFPYDAHAYCEVGEILADQGCHVVAPFLRGYGATRFLSPATPRSGQQGALAGDLLALIRSLALEKPVLAGYDWGGRAACIVAALWPAHCGGLVTGEGYNIQDIATSHTPAAPEAEHRLWYQYYFSTERGRAGLQQGRREFCRLLWKLWSPTWNFDEATYGRSADSFENPDFVDVVIHSYRHRQRLADGDPAFDAIEVSLARQPAIGVPTVSLSGADDGVSASPWKPNPDARFVGTFKKRALAGAGHNLPQEKPLEFANACLEVGREA